MTPTRRTVSRPTQPSANKSAKSGAKPSWKSNASAREETNELANDLPDNMRIHRFLQSEERGTAQQWWCGPGPHSCKVTHEVSSLSAPSASCFDANNHQTAAFSSKELMLLAFVVSASSCEDNSICGGCPDASQSVGCQCASDRHVHSQLRSWNRGSPLARTSMALSSAAGTATLVSRSLVLHRTNAPASTANTGLASP